MKRFLKFVYIGAIALVLFGLWYQNKYSMDTVVSQEFNNPELSTKIVIATQGSEYKDQVTELIVNALKNYDAYIKVIDVSQLPTIEMNNYKAIVIIHTWEMWKAPTEVTSFVDLHNRSNMFLIGTSGGGDLSINDVDGITSASVIINAEVDAQKAVIWLKNKINIE